MAAPKPFQLTAVGEMVRQDYSFGLQLVLPVVVSLTSYVVEIPVLSYALRPGHHHRPDHGVRGVAGRR